MLDVDGVLVHGRPGDGLRWDTYLKRDLGISRELLADEFFRREWGDIVVGKKDLLPTLYKVLGRIAPSVRAEEFIAYWFEMDSRIEETVMSDVREARKLGIFVCLATNQEHMRAAYLMHAMGLRDEVDGIVYSAKAGSKKPQAEFYSFAEHQLDRAPHELLLVDDTLQNVDAAQSVGWKAVHWDGCVKLSEILRNSIQ